MERGFEPLTAESLRRRNLAVLLGGVRDPGEGIVDTGSPVVVREADPARFKAAFAAAAARKGPVFLADPAWGAAGMGRLAAIIERGKIGREFAGHNPRRGEARGGRGWLMIPSGGTGGGLKFARHDVGTIAAAVAGFERHFGLSPVTAHGVLPLHHVSGFMAWMRCVLTGGIHRDGRWKELEEGRLPALPAGSWCLSLVPTQLQRLLRSRAAVEWLRRFRIVFVGGGPTWTGLADEAARLGLPLSLGYGATETAAMAAALKPEEFLAGMRGCGSAMPHARIELSPGGQVRVGGKSVFLGYYPDWRSAGPWTTDDLGEISGDGRLRILGRSDAMIITGGKKADPLEIETALRAAGVFDDVAVVGMPDPEWGQVVVACHSGAARPVTGPLAKALAGLSAHLRPKRFVAIDPWPRNAQGKVNRAELTRLAASARD